MAGKILTIASSITCLHGGRALLFTTNARVRVDGAPALLESDVLPVVGCPFYDGSKYSPCIRIEWSAGASKVKVNGTRVLVRSSIGKCLNAQSATQGLALILNTQVKATAQ